MIILYSTRTVTTREKSTVLWWGYESSESDRPALKDGAIPPRKPSEPGCTEVLVSEGLQSTWRECQEGATVPSKWHCPFQRLPALLSDPGGLPPEQCHKAI